MRAWGRRVPGWARRPGGLVEQTRWLFCGCALLALGLTMPGPLLSTNSDVAALVVVYASVVLAASWAWRYRTGGDAAWLDVVAVLATTAFAAACPDPAMAFGFAFSASWLRVLYGSTTRVVLYGLGTVAAFAAAIPLWALVPGHVGSTAAAPTLGALPVLFLTIVVARHLALVLFAREQSQRRDTALLQLGSHLLGVTDRDEVSRLAWEAIGQICLATPGLRALAARDAFTHLQVTGHAGVFRRSPTVVGMTVPVAAHAAEARPVADVAALEEIAGFTGSWICISLPEPLGEVLLLGSPDGVPPDAVVAVQSLVNQVALALRTSDAHQDLAQQALTDSLTGLANRTAFTAALEAAMAEDRPAPTLLFLDLDDFKGVNDRLGHSAGDELLRHVADRLRATVRAHDLCARLGGDEFAVLLPDPDPEVAGAVAQRLVELIAAPVALSGRLARVGVSIGIARATPGLTGAQLVQRADTAMYAAKSSGKNRVRAFDLDLPPVAAVV